MRLWTLRRRNQQSTQEIGRQFVEQYFHEFQMSLRKGHRFHDWFCKDDALLHLASTFFSRNKPSLRAEEGPFPEGNTSDEYDGIWQVNCWLNSKYHNDYKVFAKRTVEVINEYWAAGTVKGFEFHFKELNEIFSDQDD